MQNNFDIQGDFCNIYNKQVQNNLNLFLSWATKNDLRITEQCLFQSVYKEINEKFQYHLKLTNVVSIHDYSFDLIILWIKEIVKIAGTENLLVFKKNKTHEYFNLLFCETYFFLLCILKVNGIFSDRFAKAYLDSFDNLAKYISIIANITATEKVRFQVHNVLLRNVFAKFYITHETFIKKP